MIDPGLRGRTAVVTGANNPHGIGAAIARALALHEARVFLTYLRESPALYGVPEREAASAEEPSEAFGRHQNTLSADATVGEIRAAGREAAALEADLSSVDQIAKLFDAAEASFGPVDILVNNAAHCLYPDTVLDTTADTIDRHFIVNTRAVVLAMQEFGRRLLRSGRSWGRIINISTDSYLHLGNTAYGASKHAMESYSRDAAHELGPHGVTVNIVSPGPVQTGFYSSQFVQRVSAQLPLRRFGRPEDIADAVVFFASQQASWITGQRLFVGGGHAM